MRALTTIGLIVLLLCCASTRRLYAAEPDYTGIKSTLAAQLESWMAQQGDKGLETELKAHSRQSGKRQKRTLRRERIEPLGTLGDIVDF